MFDLESVTLEMLVSHTPVALGACDAEGNLLLMSPALQALLGGPLVAPSAHEWVEAFGLLAADGRTPLTTADVPLVRALQGELVADAIVVSQLDGRRLHLRCNASPLRADDDAVVGALVLVQDVTSERAAADEQALLRSRLVETINHEIRTPLAKIIGHSELLGDDELGLPPAARRSVDVIATAAEDLMGLAGVITDLSDLEAHTRLSPTYGNVAGLLREVVDEHRPRASRGIELVCSVPDRVTATIDPAEVRKAVSALLDNALTYAPDGSVVQLHLSSGDNHIAICVYDEGRGIGAAERERLVKPFERGDHPRQPVNSRGLGLAIAHTVAAAHGGDLVLEEAAPTHSPPGLKVVLRLPRYGTVTIPAAAP